MLQSCLFYFYQLLVLANLGFGPFRADVSVRACTSCPPLLITIKQKGRGRSCWILLLSSVRECYTYKLQHLQFGVANCRLPAALHFYLFRGPTVMYCWFRQYMSMSDVNFCHSFWNLTRVLKCRTCVINLSAFYLICFPGFLVVWTRWNPLANPERRLGGSTQLHILNFLNHVFA